MPQSKEKIRLIFIPFLRISIGSIAAYTFFNWLIFIRFQLISVDEFINQDLLSVIFPAIALLIWVRPRVKLLDIKTKWGSRLGLYMYISIIFVGVLSVITQSYISTATGKLTTLDNIRLINNTNPTKYYELKKFFIDKKNIGVQRYEDINVYNKGYQTIFTIYIVLPIYESIVDTTNKSCYGWVGVRYLEEKFAHLSVHEVQDFRQSFIKNSQESFNNLNAQNFVYLERVGNSMDKNGYTQAIFNDSKISTVALNIFKEVNEPFENKNGHILSWAIFWFGLSSGIFLIMIVIPSFDKSKLQEFYERNGSPTSKNE